MKILLAIDGSKCSDVSVSDVATRPWPTGSTVRVLSVIEPVTVPVPEAVTMSESWYGAMRETAHSFINRAVLALKQSSKLEIESVIRIGSAADSIVQEAREWQADLIVIGSHGRGRTVRFFLGSVSQAVAMHAPCSVEVIRGQRIHQDVTKDYGNLRDTSANTHIRQIDSC